MKIFIGYDPRDHYAYHVAKQSIVENSSIDVEITPVLEWRLRASKLFWRSYRVDQNGQMWDERDGRPFSTQFSFTRFAIPLMTDFTDEWVLFMDADMMFRADVKELVDLIDQDKSVMCVQHNHQPTEAKKMDGVIQARYFRKNWSSFMLMKPSGCSRLTKYELNNATGTQLQAMTWVEDEKIGALPPEWNHLVGYDDPEASPKNVHFTLGTPDMPLSPESKWDREWWECLERAGKGARL